VRSLGPSSFSPADVKVDCLCYSDASSLVDDNGQDDDILAKRTDTTEDSPSLGRAFDYAIRNESTTSDNTTRPYTGRPENLETATMRTCPSITIPIPDYSNVNQIAFFECVADLGCQGR
jgi:hypothetical protein